MSEQARNEAGNEGCSVTVALPISHMSQTDPMAALRATTNLPNFPGASVVYSRAERIASHINAAAYAAQRANHSRKTGFRFSPDPVASAICDAMARGDEHFLKSAFAQNLTIALSLDAESRSLGVPVRG